MNPRLDTPGYWYAIGPTTKPVPGTPTDDPAYVPCFVEGTEIMTPQGPRLVQDIAPGDETRDPQGKTHKVVWVRHKTISSAVDQINNRVIIMRAHAISHRVPSHDLYVTGDHCVSLSGVLFPVRMLVNDLSIVEASLQPYTVYHIETAEHSLLLANGMACESYLDTGNRDSFVSQSTRAPSPVKSWETDSVLPLQTSSEIGKPIYDQIKARAEKTQQMMRQTRSEDVARPQTITIVDQNGQTLSVLEEKSNLATIRLHEDTRSIFIRSSTFSPYKKIGAYVDDRRHLGVLVGEITLHLPHDTLKFRQHLESSDFSGWHQIEDGDKRWTNGAGAIVLPDEAIGLASAVTIPYAF